MTAISAARFCPCGTAAHHSDPKAGKPLNAHLDHRNPLVFDTHELGRRPGALQRLTRSAVAPKDFGIEGVVGVPEGAPLDLKLRLESVMDGVLVTGTARATAKGECVRCLEPLELDVAADFQEMFSYPVADDRGRAKAEPADDDEDDEDRLFLEDGLFDLESVLRDAVVLALPMQPVCREDCAGLCPTCGVRLDDEPDHHHDAVDIRWAALQGLAGTIQDGEKDNISGAAESGVDEKQEK
ncbi:YceD family protein [Streptomyces hypolithicus]